MRENRGALLIDEEALVDAARQGDGQAFDQLWDVYSPRIWRLVYRILRRTAEAQVIVREVALAADRALPAYAGEIPFALWLTRIAVLRALARLEHNPEPAPPRPTFEPQPDLSGLAPDERARRLIACRRTLPGPWRAALALRDGEGLSWEDIEVVQGLPPDGARTRVARARAALLKCATGAGDETEDDPRQIESLSALADDDLAPKEREQAEKLVASRTAARKLFVNLQTVRGAGAEDEDPTPPDSLREQIRAALPPRDASPRRRRETRVAAAAARRPVPRIVGIGVLACAVLVGGYYVLVERGIARRLWNVLHAAATAPAPSAAETPAPPGSASPEASPTSAPAPTPQPPADSAPLTAPTESRAPAAAPTTSPAAPSLPSQTPAAVPVESMPAAGSRTAEAGNCSVTWRAPQGAPWPWSGKPPADSAWRLGKLAERLGGRGLLQDGDPRQVRITIPAGQWSALLESLRGLGVTPREVGQPPAAADCVSLAIASAPPP